jgi:hypothetical protein
VSEEKESKDRNGDQGVSVFHDDVEARMEIGT